MLPSMRFFKRTLKLNVLQQPQRSQRSTSYSLKHPQQWDKGTCKVSTSYTRSTGLAVHRIHTEGQTKRGLANICLDWSKVRLQTPKKNNHCVWKSSKKSHFSSHCKVRVFSDGFKYCVGYIRMNISKKILMTKYLVAMTKSLLINLLLFWCDLKIIKVVQSGKIWINC